MFPDNFSVISYHPSNCFTMSTLSKLEGVSSISIVSSLSLVRTKLASTAEVTLDLDESTRLGFIENPKVYVEILIGQWEAGKSPHSPTWKKLLAVLQMLGLKSIGQEIEDYMRGEIYNQSITF